MDEKTHKDLEACALRIRERVLRMATGGGCFLGASFSCVDLLVFLYSRFLRFRGPDDPERDFLLLSKGHDVPALYGTFVELGYLDAARLKKHLSASDSIYWHPNRGVRGVEFHSGSLGHLLSVGIGVAMDAKWKGEDRRVVVLMGDGECNEGSVWESLLVASAHRLDNLIVLIDRNGVQANARTEELIPLEPFEEKFRSFGVAVQSVDGHDFGALDETFSTLPLNSARPLAVIARTVRGKGLPSLEGRVDRWFCDFAPDEIEQLVQELHGGASAQIVSEALVVR
jgi:transketolase